VNAIDLRAELERLHSASFAWAMHCSRQRRNEAEDLLQDAYIRVLEGRACFDGRSTLKTWLFGVIRNVRRERARRDWLRLAVLERRHGEEPAAEPALNPEQLLHRCENNHRLREAVERLPRRQQELMHLVFYQDLTIAESALALGISLGSARTHFERGKARLREHLAAEQST
jgi:RNA polymerase sigma-70 factor (ECF subfamily)